MIDEDFVRRYPNIGSSSFPEYVVKTIVSDVVKIIVRSLLGLTGLAAFMTSDEWYWKTLGFIFSLNLLGIILPLFELIWFAISPLIVVILLIVNKFKKF